MTTSSPPFFFKAEGMLYWFITLVNNVSTELSVEIAARHKQYEYYRDTLLSFKEKVS